MSIKQKLRPYQVEVGRAILDSVMGHKGLTFTVEVARQGGKNELSAQLELLLLTIHMASGGNLIKAAPTYMPQLLNSIFRLRDRLNDAGITFGYHNHAHEFERTESGAGTLYDILIDDTGPEFTLEIDVYWAIHAGVNPEALIRRCHGRVPVIHVKDKQMLGADSDYAPVGEGNLDWPGILPACREAGTQWYAVEQDSCRRDPFDCLRSSFDFLVANGI